MKKDQNNKQPTLINMTEAAALLGYQSAQVIKKLVSEGFLNRYHILDSRRIYVERNEVESLIQPVDINDISKENVPIG